MYGVRACAVEEESLTFLQSVVYEQYTIIVLVSVICSSVFKRYYLHAFIYNICILQCFIIHFVVSLRGRNAFERSEEEGL